MLVGEGGRHIHRGGNVTNGMKTWKLSKMPFRSSDSNEQYRFLFFFTKLWAT